MKAGSICGSRCALVGGALFGLVLLAGCGGSASETPWPIEPDNVDLGPAGETRRDDPPSKAAGPADSSHPADPNKKNDEKKSDQPTGPLW